MTEMITIDLDPDACAFIEFALRQARASALDDIETCLQFESPECQREEDSETFHAGRRLAIADNLIDVMVVAVCVSVTLPRKP